MTYEIRTYSEEYLEKQFEIGNSHLKDWPGTGQTQVDNLKQYYARDNFDPETKFYAFKDGEMVGFQTATIKPLKEGETVVRANMEFPLVVEGHDAAIDLLMEHAMHALRAKGVGRVQSRGSPLWGNTMDLVTKYNYELKRTLSQSGVMSLSNYSDSGIEGARPFEESDLDAVRRMYIEEMKMPEQQVDNQFNFLSANPDAIAAWNLYIEDGVVLGNSIVTYLGGDRSKGIMSNIFASGEREAEIREKILNAHLRQLKERGVEELTVLLFGQWLDRQSEYEKYGMQFNLPLNLYHRDL